MKQNLLNQVNENLEILEAQLDFKEISSNDTDIPICPSCSCALDEKEAKNYDIIKCMMCCRLIQKTGVNPYIFIEINR